MNEEKGLPLGLCRQSVMKLESALNDFNEIMEDESINDEQRLLFETLAETTGRIMASVINVVSQELGEDEFLGEQIEMDKIDMYPDGSYPLEEVDIMDEEL